MKTFPMQDFSGGWNSRDAWSQLGDNESQSLFNVTFDERGGIVKRLGLQRTGAPNYGSNTSADRINVIYYSHVFDQILVQVGTQLKYLDHGPDGSWSPLLTAFTTADRVSITDFVGITVIIHPVDGCYLFNGTSLSGPVTNSPNGRGIAVWQNALWSIYDHGNGSRVTRSNLGDPSWPVDPVYVDIRAKDDQALTAIGGGIGMDPLGRDGLLVWKESSHYRINDPTTASYTVENYTHGAAGSQAVATNQGVTVAISKNGIVATTGSGTPGVIVSDKISNLFHPSVLVDPGLDSNLANMVATTYRDKFVFSVTWQHHTINNMSFEWHPVHQWFAPHDFGMGCATERQGELLAALTSLSDGNVDGDGFLYRVFKGWLDDTAVFNANHQTRWFEPNNGNMCRYRRLLVNGHGNFIIRFKVDYDATENAADWPISILDAAAQWDAGIWDVSTFGDEGFQGWDKLFSLGYGRVFSIEVSDDPDDPESASASAYGPKLLGVGDPEEKGSWSLYGYDLDIQPLGNS
jgi:hypothetical protein